MSLKTACLNTTGKVLSESGTVYTVSLKTAVAMHSELKWETIGKVHSELKTKVAVTKQLYKRCHLKFL